MHNVQLVGMTFGEAMGVARWEVIGYCTTSRDIIIMEPVSVQSLMHLRILAMANRDATLVVGTLSFYSSTEVTSNSSNVIIKIIQASNDQAHT